MDKPKVSVIIPVYNVEKYLKQCLDSVINQTLSDIEIICVNDGSTDNSLQILEEYAIQDERIRIITQKNQGQGTARNNGLKHAKGEYISFVDSDDWISLNAYEKLYKNAKTYDSDIVMHPTYIFDDATKEFNYNNPYYTLEYFSEEFDDRVFNHEHTQNIMFNICETIWNKLYSNNFLKKINARFPENLVFEDNPFFYEIYLKADKITVIREYLYNYRINRNDSVMSQNDKFDEIVETTDLIIEKFKETNNYDKYRLKLRNYIFNCFINRFNQVESNHKDEFFDIIKNKLEKMNLKKQEIKVLHPKIKQEVQYFMNSSSYKEYKQLKINGNKKPKVSVIIPVYTVEKYLKQCLDSVINQTLRDIEIICVNDGSTDNSLQILEEYAIQDKRIKIINQENQGLGAARNTGLKHVNGEYVSFVDSDDWIDLNTYEKLYKNAQSNNSDIVMFDITLYDENKDKYSFYTGVDDISLSFNDKNIDFNNFSFDYSQIKPFVLNRRTAAWYKIYKTDFLKSYDDFFFPVGILYEDIPFHVQAMLRAGRISYCPSKLYFYRTSNKESIINTSRKNREVFDIFTIVNNVKNILTNDNKMNEFKKEFIALKIVQLMYWFNLCDENIKEEFFKLMKNTIPEKEFNHKDNGVILNEFQNRLVDEYSIISKSNYYDEYKKYKKLLKQESVQKNLKPIDKQKAPIMTSKTNPDPSKIQLGEEKQKYEKIFKDQERRINDLLQNKAALQIVLDSLKTENCSLKQIYVDYGFPEQDYNNITFIIPYRKTDDPNREENMDITLGYLSKIGIKNVIISEHANISSKNDLIKKYNELFDSFKAIFNYDNSELFNRSIAINRGVMACSTPYFSIFDMDCLVRKKNIDQSLYLLDKGFDIVYPFNRLVQDIVDKNNFKKDYNFNKVDSELQIRNWADGGIVFWNKRSFLNIGMANEYFDGWGGEDNEILMRANLYQLKQFRIDDILYHLYHDRPQIRSENNRKQRKKTEKIKNKEELLKEINKWPWVIEAKNKFPIKNKKVFSISVVKNEMDIIESFVRYNANVVDGMIILDNGSYDDTLKILNLLKKEDYPIFIFENENENNDKYIKMNGLLKKAIEEFNADIVVPLDADEFIISSNQENPRIFLEEIDLDSCHLILWKNYVPDFEKNKDEKFIPAKITNSIADNLEKFYKVIISKNLVKNYDVKLSRGQNNIEFDSKYNGLIKIVYNNKLRMAHFPIRSIKQLVSKISVGCIEDPSSMERKENQIWNWKKMFDQLKNNKMIEEKDIVNFTKNYFLTSEKEIQLEEAPLDTSFYDDIGMEYTNKDVNPLKNLLETNLKLSEDYQNFKKESFAKEKQMMGNIKELSIKIIDLDKIQKSNDEKAQIIADENKLLKNKIIDYDKKAQIIADENKLLKNKIAIYENSNSWALTSPLRKIGIFIRNLRNKF